MEGSWCPPARMRPASLRNGQATPPSPQALIRVDGVRCSSDGDEPQPWRDHWKQCWVPLPAAPVLQPSRAAPTLLAKHDDVSVHLALLPRGSTARTAQHAVPSALEALCGPNRRWMLNDDQRRATFAAAIEGAWHPQYADPNLVKQWRRLQAVSRSKGTCPFIRRCYASSSAPRPQQRGLHHVWRWHILAVAGCVAGRRSAAVCSPGARRRGLPFTSYLNGCQLKS